MECRMSERLTAASSEVKRLLGDEITAATSQTENRTATTATPTPEHRVDVAQVVAAQGDVAPGAEDAPGVAERAGGEHHEATTTRSDRVRSLVAGVQQGHPHEGAEEEARARSRRR